MYTFQCSTAPPFCADAGRKCPMSKKTVWISKTAVLTAMLIALQFVTKAMGQLVTGSCVNLLLTVAALYGGWWCGFTVALLSPFLAFLLGIGPSIIVLVPLIAVGNIVLVAVFALLRDRLPGYVNAVIAAVLKFAALWLLVVKLALPLLQLPEKQSAVIGAMFTYPQLITALIGGILGVTVSLLLKKNTGSTIN